MSEIPSPSAGVLKEIKANEGQTVPINTIVAVIDAASGKEQVLTASLDRNCAPSGIALPPVWIGDSVLFAVEDHGNVHLYQAPSDGSGSPVPARHQGR